MTASKKFKICVLIFSSRYLASHRAGRSIAEQNTREKKKKTDLVHQAPRTCSLSYHVSSACLSQPLVRLGPTTTCASPQGTLKECCSVRLFSNAARGKKKSNRECCATHETQSIASHPRPSPAEKQTQRWTSGHTERPRDGSAPEPIEQKPTGHHRQIRFFLL